jgi:hypothetical protein
MTETTPSYFAATFGYEGDHGYCFSYHDDTSRQYRWKNIPHELEEKLTNKLKPLDKAEIAWLSIGLNSRFWMRYNDGKDWVNGNDC